MSTKIIYIICLLLGLLIAFLCGIFITENKLFPYYEIRTIKRIIASDTSINPNNATKKFNPFNQYKLDKMSYFREHANKVEIVMFGDSFTDYAEWKDMFPQKNIANQGIAGDTTKGALDRIDIIHKSEPTKVFIMLGTNDIIRGKNVNDIYLNYKLIIDSLVDNKFKVYIQSTLLIGEEKPSVIDKSITTQIFNKNVGALNNMLKELSDATELVTFINLNEALSDGIYLNEKFTDDGLHLNKNGYILWKDIINPYIN